METYGVSFEGFYAASVESTEKSVADAATIVEELKNCLRFWEHALEVMKMHHVFEKAELRYKTKICREIVKELTRASAPRADACNGGCRRVSTGASWWEPRWKRTPGG